MPEGGVDSFQVVFHRSFGEIYGYVAYRLAPDWNAAQDVAQETFLAAWQAWASYRGDGPVVSWLRGIARRKVADHLRAEVRRRDAAKAKEPAYLATSDHDRLDELALLLGQVMRLLPPENVEVLEEKYLEGLSVRQIAAKRARTEKSVESALSRARDLFRRTFRRLQMRDEVRE
jgi:RNA polymerase sigma-70 factor (ECF subfamily)